MVKIDALTKKNLENFVQCAGFTDTEKDKLNSIFDEADNADLLAFVINIKKYCQLLSKNKNLYNRLKAL